MTNVIFPERRLTLKLFNNVLYLTIFSLPRRPTNKAAAQKPNGKGMEVGIADDQAKDFDFEKTEMKYDSTGMFHWTPARAIEDCILVIIVQCSLINKKNICSVR